MDWPRVVFHILESGIPSCILNSRIKNGAMLKTQDVVVAGYLACYGGQGAWTFSRLGEALGMSASQVHGAVERGSTCLLLSNGSDAPWGVQRKNLFTLCVHGLRFVFPAQLGAESRGMVTAQAAPLFRQLFVDQGQAGPVWPDAEGDARGPSLEPLHRSALAGVKKAPDKRFYELLCCIEVLRCGQARERAIAEGLLRKRLLSHG